jgi:hypothetical protein
VPPCIVVLRDVASDARGIPERMKEAARHAHAAKLLRPIAAERQIGALKHRDGRGRARLLPPGQQRGN